jgi:hypothetical protein
MTDALTCAPRALRGVAKLRQRVSSVAPVAYGYERSLRPTLAYFSQPQSSRGTGVGR